jgi:hypothetical protein
MSQFWLRCLLAIPFGANQTCLMAMSVSDRSARCEDQIWSIAAPLPESGAAPGKFMSQSQLLHILSAFIEDTDHLPLQVEMTDGTGRILIRCRTVAVEVRDIFAGLSTKRDGLAVLQAAKSELLDSGLFNQLRSIQPRVIQIPDSAVELAGQIFGAAAQEMDLKLFGGWQKLAGPDGFELRSPSRVKARTRALYRGDGFSLALTLEPQFVRGMEQGAVARVIETEVIVRRQLADANGNHNHDFYVYDSEGKLAKCSSFFSGKAIVIGSSPQTCMSCHYDSATKTFGLEPDSFVGRPIENWENFPVETLPILHACPKNG